MLFVTTMQNTKRPCKRPFLLKKMKVSDKCCGKSITYNGNGALIASDRAAAALVCHGI